MAYVHALDLTTLFEVIWVLWTKIEKTLEKHEFALRWHVMNVPKRYCSWLALMSALHIHRHDPDPMLGFGGSSRLLSTSGGA